MVEKGVNKPWENTESKHNTQLNWEWLWLLTVRKKDEYFYGI